jgi:hypothetical protein
MQLRQFTRLRKKQLIFLHRGDYDYGVLSMLFHSGFNTYSNSLLLALAPWFASRRYSIIISHYKLDASNFYGI